MEIPNSPRPGSHALASDDARAVVARNFWGVLSTVGDDAQPYAVPIIYGYDGAFYAVIRDGRKARNLDLNPRACLSIVEVDDLAKTWRSVVALGSVRFMETDIELNAALDIIRAQYPGEPTRSGGGPEALRAQGFRVMKLLVEELTGRAQE